jgi:hypothetical protein
MRRPSASLWASAALVALAASGLSACGSDNTGPVPVATANPTPRAAAVACDRLDDALPITLIGQSQRPTSPDSPTTAAWGDPEIVLTCGVPRPAARAPGAQLFEIDGITWFAEELTAGTRFTSEGREANVQVDVPDDYRPEAEALVDLAPSIKASIPAARGTAD